MLQRSSQIGEFYRMSPPAVFDMTKKLPSSYMDILVYDEEGDKLTHIEFKHALYATCASDAADVADLITGTKDETEQLNKLRNIANVAANHIAQAKIKGADGTSVMTSPFGDGTENLDTLKAKFTIQNIINAVQAGVCVKICIVIARPFIEHHMLSAVAAVSGRDTGATLYGPSDMQISANTSVKTIEGACNAHRTPSTRSTAHPKIARLTSLPLLLLSAGHFTCYTKSVITKPQNVFILRDVMCNGYVAGGNCKFFGAGGKLPTTTLNPEDVKREIQERLAYTDDVDSDYASMLAFLCPYDEVEAASRDQVISISERLLPWEVNQGNGTDKTAGGFPGGQMGFAYYMKKYGLNQIHFGEDIRAAENMEFVANGSMNNATCIVGPHRRYSPYSQNFYELVPGQGHMGPDAIPGVSVLSRSNRVCTEDRPPPPPPLPLPHPLSFPCSSLSLPCPVAGRPLAPWRDGVPPVGAAEHDQPGGGGALAARPPPGTGADVTRVCVCVEREREREGLCETKGVA